LYYCQQFYSLYAKYEFISNIADVVRQLSKSAGWKQDN